MSEDFKLRRTMPWLNGLRCGPSSGRIKSNSKPNEFRLKAHRTIEWKPQLEKAIEAFDRNGFFMPARAARYHSRMYSSSAELEWERAHERFGFVQSAR